MFRVVLYNFIDVLEIVTHPNVQLTIYVKLSVSQIWTSLPCLNFLVFGFRLEQISFTAPKKLGFIQKWSKVTQK